MRGGTVSLPALNEALGIGRSRRGTVRDYSHAKPGSRAKGRGERRGRRVWIAGDFRAGEFRTRREALRHSPAGTRPLLVTLGATPRGGA